jgi:putative ABC transport system permease protein
MRSLLTVHLRQAARGLRRNPTFTIAVLFTLAIAIGANTAVFSVVNGVLINPLPYPEPESLVDVLTRAPGAPGGGIQ